MPSKPVEGCSDDREKLAFSAEFSKSTEEKLKIKTYNLMVILT